MKDRMRAAIWLALSLALYALAFSVEHLQMQTLFYKLGHVTVAAHFGYWVSRNTLGRITETSHPMNRLARAIVIGACMLAVSQGL